MKTDYQKGVTAGLAILRKAPRRYREYPHAHEHELRDLRRKLTDKYRDQIGELPCPITGEPSYMRVSWYEDGIRHAIEYGHGAKFLLVRHNDAGGAYTVDSLHEQTVYDDPAIIWKRSWELDPQGHKYKGLDALYVNGACKAFGLESFYGL